MARALRSAEAGAEWCVAAPRTAVLVVRDGEVRFEIVGRAGPEGAWEQALRNAGAGDTLVSPLPPPASQFDQVRAVGPGALVLGSAMPGGLEGLEGVEVRAGILEASCAELNPAVLCGRPWVRLKLAMSLDGRTALSNGASQWITGSDARADVQRLRARSGALVTGVGTVLADDPRLNVRTGDAGIDTVRRWRVVLDSAFRTPASAVLLQEPSLACGPVEIWGTAEAPAQRGECLEVPADPEGRVAIEHVVRELGRRGVQEILFECGAALAGTLLESGLLDELVVYIAPKLLGHRGRGLVELPEYTAVDQAPGMRLVQSRQIGEDVRLILRNV